MHAHCDENSGCTGAVFSTFFFCLLGVNNFFELSGEKRGSCVVDTDFMFCVYVLARKLVDYIFGSVWTPTQKRHGVTKFIVVFIDYFIYFNVLHCLFRVLPHHSSC